MRQSGVFLIRPRTVTEYAATIGFVGAAWGCLPSAEKESPRPVSAAPVIVHADRPAVDEPPSAEPIEPSRVVPPGRRHRGPPLGIPACDLYLALYEDCEPRLRGEIDSGQRRSPEAERAWLAYVASTPERVTLEQGCMDMTSMIRDRCR
jgi:hypothetical protein